MATLLALAALAEPVRPELVEAALVRNFVRYVRWPAASFQDGQSPWRVCVMGPGALGTAVERAVEGRVEQGRAFVVRPSPPRAELPRCHLVFMSGVEQGARRAALEALRGHPVLTVGDTPGFLEEGGVIHLLVEDHVQLRINLDQARAASLEVETRMLEVAREVLEAGVLRRVR